MINIYPIIYNKKQYLDLLLLADEQESMIDRYLKRGDMFVLAENNEIKASCVITEEGKKIAADFTEKLSNDLEAKFFKLDTDEREKYLEAIETLATLVNKSELS